MSKVGNQLTKTKELLSEIKRNNIDIEHPLRVRLLELLKWSEKPEENLTNLENVYKTVVLQILSRYTPVILKCTADYTSYHKEILELLKKIGSLRDWRPSIYLEKVISNLIEFANDPCYLIKQPLVLDLLYNVDLQIEEFVGKISKVFSCDSSNNVEKAVGGFIVTAKSLEDLRERSRKLKDDLSRVSMFVDKEGDYSKLLESLTIIVGEIESGTYLANVTKTLVNSLKNEMIRLVNVLNQLRSAVCSATSYEEIGRSLNSFTDSVSKTIFEVNGKFHAYKASVERVSSKFKAQLMSFRDLRVSSIDEVLSKVKLLKEVDTELSKILAGIPDKERSVFETLLQLYEEGGGRPIRIDRSLVQKLKRDELDVLIKLCVEEILNCMVSP